jgi:hypothetical protein
VKENKEIIRNDPRHISPAVLRKTWRNTSPEVLKWKENQRLLANRAAANAKAAKNKAAANAKAAKNKAATNAKAAEAKAAKNKAAANALQRKKKLNETAQRNELRRAAAANQAAANAKPLVINENARRRRQQAARNAAANANAARQADRKRNTNVIVNKVAVNMGLTNAQKTALKAIIAKGKYPAGVNLSNWVRAKARNILGSGNNASARQAPATLNLSSFTNRPNWRAIITNFVNQTKPRQAVKNSYPEFFTNINKENSYYLGRLRNSGTKADTIIDKLNELAELKQTDPAAYNKSQPNIKRLREYINKYNSKMFT